MNFSPVKKILGNKTVQSTLMYGTSIVFMKGLSLILLPFLTHNLTQAQYGELEVLTTLATIGSVIAGFGLAETLFRYCGMTKSKEEEKYHADRLLTLSFLAAIILSIASYFYAPFISQLIPGEPSVTDVNIILLIISFEAVIAVSLGWLRMKNKVKHFCVITCARALLQIFLTYLFVTSGFAVTGMLCAGLLSSSLQALVLGYLLKAHINLALFKSSALPYFTYGIPVMLSGGVAFFLFGVDKWFLATYSSLENVAIYSVAGKLALMVVILLQPFTMWWSPKRFQILNKQGAIPLLLYVYIGLLLLANISVLIAGVSPILVTYLMPESYQGALYIMAPLILMMMLKEAIELINIGCFIGKYCHAQLTINIITAIITCLMMFYYVPSFGMIAVAWSLCIGQILRLLLFFCVSQKVLPINYDIKSLMIIFAITCVAIILLTKEYSLINSFAVMPAILLLLNAFALITLFRQSFFNWLQRYEAVKRFKAQW